MLIVQPINGDLLSRIDRYIEEMFAPLDEALQHNLQASGAAGLPAINVSAAEGKLLYLLARMAGARRVLEIGTLGGFSTTWLARAVAPGGHVVTLDVNPAHAEVARRNLAEAAVGATIDLRVGDASALLQQMITAEEPAFDLVFIDADKERYVKYLELALQLSRPGTVILADNVIRHGDVIDPATQDPNARGARDYNAAIASHPRLESVVLPILRDKVDGLAISIVR
jgi:predicted O-methyltransferase YrrM